MNDRLELEAKDKHTNVKIFFDGQLSNKARIIITQRNKESTTTTTYYLVVKKSER